MQSFYHKLGSALWGVIVVLLVTLAVYVSVGRLLVSSLDRYHDAILQELNIRAPFDIQAEGVSGRWVSFTPVIVLSELRVTLPESPETPLQLSQGRVGIDVWRSLLTRSLQITQLRLDGLSLRGEFSSDGAFRLRGFSGGPGGSGAWIQEFLLNAKHILLKDNVLRVTLPSGEVRDLDLDLTLTRTGSSRRIEAILTTNRGADIAVLAQGLGNPFEPDTFNGDLYVDVKSSDLGAVKDMFPGATPAVWADGRLEVQFWLSWDKGEPSLEGRVEAHDLLVAPREGDWRIPLEGMSFLAKVDRERDTWTIFAEELRLQNEAVAVELPRLQLDLWAGAIRLRAADIYLQQIAALVGNQQTLPEQFTELLWDLNPQAEIDSLQLSVGDIEDPAQDWEIEATFDELTVQPWKGAPGVESGRGYVQLRPGEGSLTLDARSFALAFPLIYDEPLRFEELYGSLFLSWDAEQVRLSSGLLSAQGEEGDVRARFALDIPLEQSAIGIEMDLIAGLADTHTRYREKYVPTVLNAGLRDWLQKSIGPGVIREGGFLWRGALKAGAGAHRTVQLGFNVEDTALDYHPEWPAVTVREAVVLVDDVRVSGWADSAELLTSTVTDLSLETDLDAEKRVTLALFGAIAGPVADGLFVVNDSPLTDIVGNVFSRWEVNGNLQTELALDLVLGEDAPAPEVNVLTEWRDASLAVAPGNLFLEDVRGQFSYSTAHGFSSRQITGRLWGEQVAVTMRQHHESGRYDPATSTLELMARGHVTLSSVHDWLGLQVLGLARGRAPVDMSLFVSPGEAARLQVRSALQGISLDLPAPWRKESDSASDFGLSMELGEGALPLSIALGDALNLNLDIEEGRLSSGSLGLSRDAPASVAGQFVISGEASGVRVDELSDFVSSYLLPDFTSSDAGDGAVGDSSDPQTIESAPVALVVDDLMLRTLELGSLTLTDVGVNLSFVESQVEAAVTAADWLRGQMQWKIGEQQALVDVEYFDLSSLPETPEQAAQEPSAEAAKDDSLMSEDFPALALSVQNIHQGERRLGHLDLNLELGDGRLLARDITGELAHIVLDADQPGSLEWNSDEPGGTHLRAALHFADLGSTLGYFGYEKIIETEEGRFDVDMHWPGSPADFALAAAGGELMVDMGEGSFLSAPSSAAGALRVVDILNLVHIVQSLSVSHMFDSGIPFDSVRGSVQFGDGIIEVPRMDIRGGSSFHFSGVSDVADETLDGELVATLPVGQNLPWVAALAAGLPVAAGVFVVSKIFDKQVDRLSSAVYRIEGTWDEPQVTFDRIFDNKQREKARAQLDAATAPGEQIAPDAAAEQAPAEEGAAESAVAPETTAPEAPEEGAGTTAAPPHQPEEVTR